MTIKRIWHGWTSPDNGDVYENLLRDEVFPGIEAKNIPGLRSIELLRDDRDGEVTFITIMTFDSLASVTDFMGEDYARSYVPDAAQKVLRRYDEFASHFEVRESRSYG